MSILCVIPVRGGSKGIPRKNIRNVAGRPLVTWTIQDALEAKAGLDVLVSTDDHEIAEIAREAGADVPFIRPSEIALDETATEPVVRHAIDFRIKQGHRPEAVMLLQATSPFRLPGTLDRAIDQYFATGVDSLVGVVPQTPFLWTKAEQPRAFYQVDNRPRRQDLQQASFLYREPGSLYLTRTEIYESVNNRLGGKIGLFVMDESEGTDIDTELDLALAEQQLRQRATLHTRGVNAE